MCHSLPFVFTPFFIPSVTLSLVTWLICVPHLIYPAMPKSILTTSLHVNNVGLPFSLKFSWVNEWIFEGWELRSSAGCDAWMPLLACYAHCLRFQNTMPTIATTIVLYLGFFEITIAFSGAQRNSDDFAETVHSISLYPAFIFFVPFIDEWRCCLLNPSSWLSY